MDSDRLQQLLARTRSFADLDDAAGLADAIADAARELTGARYAALAILNSDGDALERLFTAGVDALDRLEIGAMPHGRGVFGELLWELAGEGRAVLIVEHDMDLIMRVCDHIHVLNFGEIIARGNMAAIQQNADVREVYLGI